MREDYPQRLPALRTGRERYSLDDEKIALISETVNIIPFP